MKGENEAILRGKNAQFVIPQLKICNKQSHSLLEHMQTMLKLRMFLIQTLCKFDFPPLFTAVHNYFNF